PPRRWWPSCRQSTHRCPPWREAAAWTSSTQSRPNESHPMLTRTNSKTVNFTRPFWLKGVDRVLPAGDYRVVTDEELIEGLSFPVYRRVATMVMVPAKNRGSIEMVVIDPLELAAAQTRDAAPASTTP